MIVFPQVCHSRKEHVDPGVTTDKVDVHCWTYRNDIQANNSSGSRNHDRSTGHCGNHRLTDGVESLAPWYNAQKRWNETRTGTQKRG